MNRVKKIVSIVLILLLMFTSISAAVSFSSVDQSSQELLRGSFEKKTWYVDDNGTADFTTVQEAVDAASPGDTIYVYSGLYIENIIVNKTVKLIGEDKNTTVLDGNDTEDTLYISGTHVEITGFTIQRAGRSSFINDFLIDLHGDHAHIHHNLFIDSKYGVIGLKESDDHLIEYNHFNTPSHKSAHTCIEFFESSRTEISNNVFTDVGMAILITGGSYDCIIRDNTMIRPIWGIQFNGAEGCAAYRNYIVDAHKGITHFAYSEMNAIYENTIKDCDWGIYSLLSGPPGTQLEAWSMAFHNNLINNNITFTQGGGTDWYAPYPAGGNYISTYGNYTDDPRDDYHGPNQDIPGSDGIYDESFQDKDRYPYVHEDGWKNRSIDPTLIVLGGFDWTTNVNYIMEPGEIRDYRFYVLNAGNTGPVRWRITEFPDFGSWDFDQESGRVTPEDGLVRVNFTITAPTEKETKFYGSLKIINEDNPDNYWILQADLATPIIHPFILLMERMYDFFEEILDYFQGIIKNI